MHGRLKGSDAGGKDGYVGGPISAAARRRETSASWRLKRISWPVIAGVLAVTDIIVVAGAALLAFVGYVGFVLGGLDQWSHYLAVAGFATVLMTLMWNVASIYNVRVLAQLRFQVRWTLALWALGLLLMAGFGFFLQASGQFSRVWVALWALLGAGGLTANRLLLSAMAGRFVARGLLSRRVALIASAARLAKLRTRFEAPSLINLYRIDLIVTPADELTDALVHAAEEVAMAARETHFDIVCMATEDMKNPAVAIDRLRDLPSDLWVAFSEPPETLLGLGTMDLAGLPVMEAEIAPMKDWAFIVKAIEDRVLGGMLLLLVAPVIALAAIAIRLESRGPAFFRQQRHGFNNRQFDIWKLRTMYVDHGDPNGEVGTSQGDARVTRVGRFLRRTSLDELPQLLNVLDGSMSLVGPRAHPVRMRVADHYYHELFSRYAARHKVKPGLTGLAQVNGNRGRVDTAQKAIDRLRHDLSYVRNWSLGLDLKILARTPGALLFGSDAY